MTTPAQLNYLKNKARSLKRLGQKSMPIIAHDFDYWLKHEANYLSKTDDPSTFIYEGILIKRIQVTKKES